MHYTTYQYNIETGDYLNGYSYFSELDNSTYSKQAITEQSATNNYVYKFTSVSTGFIAPTSSCFSKYFSSSAWFKPITSAVNYLFVTESINLLSFNMGAAYKINCSLKGTNLRLNVNTDTNWNFITCSISKKDITISRLQASDNTYLTISTAINVTSNNLFTTISGQDKNCVDEVLNFKFLSCTGSSYNILVKDLQVYNTYKDLNAWKIIMFR